MLFVDDEQLQVFQGRKHSGACADNDRSATVKNSQPLFDALLARQRTVENGDTARESRGKPFCQLGRQSDLRNEDETRVPARERVFRSLNVDLGLSAPRHTMQQLRRKP